MAEDEATAPESNTEEFIDDDGLKHIISKVNGITYSSETFDKKGRLIEQGIYDENNSYVGAIKYNTDENGVHHRQVYDAHGNLTWDLQKNDSTLLRETFYENGKAVSGTDFVTYESFNNGRAGINLAIEQKAFSIERFNDYLNPKVKSETVNTTLPAVRGQEMPARTQETQQEQPDLHPVRVEQPDLHPVRVEQTAETVNTILPAVRGNEMPERAQEARTTEDKENLFTNNFIKLIQQGNKYSSDDERAFVNSLQDLIKDYQMQGLSAQEATEKMSAVLSSAYDLGIEQGLAPDVLKTSISQLSEGLGLSAEANQEGMTVANNVAQMDAPTVSRPRFQDDMDIEDAEIIEEIPAEPVVENDGNETAGTPVATVKEYSEKLKEISGVDW
ncbi:MAG: hypothetical protein ACI4TE_06260, partial [Alphaproteobacteria bacterium]